MDPPQDRAWGQHGASVGETGLATVDLSVAGSATFDLDLNMVFGNQ